MIGLRARYNLYKAFYLTAESDAAGLASDPTSLCRFMVHWAAKLPAASVQRRVTGIIMMISATRAPTVSFINFRFTAHKLTSG